MTSITEGQSVGGVAPMLQKLKNVHKFTSLSKKELFISSFEQFLLKFHVVNLIYHFSIFFYFLGTGSKKRNGPKSAKLKKKKSRYGSDPRSSPFDFD